MRTIALIIGAVTFGLAAAFVSDLTKLNAVATTLGIIAAACGFCALFALIGIGAEWSDRR